MNQYMDKSHREPATGKKLEIWILEDFKSPKSRSRKNEKEPRVVENRRDCRMQMWRRTRRPTPIAVCYNKYKL